MRPFAAAKYCLYIPAVCLVGLGMANPQVHTASPAAAATSGPAQQNSSSTAGSFSSLDALPSNVLGYGQSSYNRDTNPLEGNTNFGHFLYSISPQVHVILDEKGPGVVDRMWFTGWPTINRSFWIKVYFNGASVPTINMPLIDMFNSSQAPFEAPLVADNSQSSGGYVSYVPLPFRSGIRILTNFRYFYNIGYDRFAAGTRVATWSKRESTTAMTRLWTNVTQNPNGSSGTNNAGSVPLIAAGSIQTISSVAGPSTIDAIKIKLPSPVTASELDNTWIQAYWDGSPTADVNAPLGLFFGMGEYGPYDTRSLPVGVEADGYMYVYFPMPFDVSATIQLVNKGSSPIGPIQYQVSYQPLTGNFGDVGYFRTAYRNSASATVGSGLSILRTAGTGSYVGTVACYRDEVSDVAPFQFLEGGELIYLDDSQTPSFYGTGTEDFFNGAYYFLKGPYSGPVSGASIKTSVGNAEEICAYRFLLGDAIPFYKNISISMHHGDYDQTRETRSWSLSYYYEKPTATLSLNDSIDLGSATSERGHHFKVGGQIWSGARTFTYAGTADTTVIKGVGRAFTGYCQFTMALNPNNSGAILRRRLDYGLANQAADVYVDGSLAGQWYTAGSDPYHRWADSDFQLPAALTRGKSSISVKVVVLPTGSPWNAFDFWLYSLS